MQAGVYRAMVNKDCDNAVEEQKLRNAAARFEKAIEREKKLNTEVDKKIKDYSEGRITREEFEDYRKDLNKPLRMLEMPLSTMSDFIQEHYARLDRLALESEKQCSICALMPKNDCIKWHYSRQGTQEIDNRAPWCQFFKLKSIEDDHICPMCGAAK